MPLAPSTGTSPKGGDAGTIRYQLSGKLNGTGFSTVRFKNEGDMELPGAAAGT